MFVLFPTRSPRVYFFYMIFITKNWRRCESRTITLAAEYIISVEQSYKGVHVSTMSGCVHLLAPCLHLPSVFRVFVRILGVVLVVFRETAMQQAVVAI